MSKYTTELRYLLENNYPLGMDKYPLWNFQNVNKNVINFAFDYAGKSIDNYRDYLNNKIFNHFYFREIGLETPERFKFFLNRKMDEIMPYYNQLYESVDLQFNPLWNVDLTETFSHEITDNGNSNTTSSENGTSTSNTSESGSEKRNENLERDENVTINNQGSSLSTNTPNTTNETINAEMDTPQSQMSVDDIKAHNFLSKAGHSLSYNSGVDTEQSSTTQNNTETTKTTNDNSINVTSDNDIESTQKNNQSASSNNTSSNSRNETYTRKQQGSSAGYTFPQNLQQWRNIMINIDMQIIEEIEELFMQLW